MAEKFKRVTVTGRAGGVPRLAFSLLPRKRLKNTNGFILDSVLDSIFQVIAGYDYGVSGMCVGEKRALTVPPHLAYGGEADLHFTIKLVEITEEGPPLEEQTTPPPSKEGQKEEL